MFDTAYVGGVHLSPQLTAQLKAWCELLGMAAGAARAPLLPLSEGERRELASDLQRVGLLRHPVKSTHGGALS
jgi:dihydrodipicolinate synthase/N-acetylneuraminate lyase